MELKSDDDDSFEFVVSDSEFTADEKDALFSNLLDDPDLHKRCKDPELCNAEECLVYLEGSELAAIQGDTYEDVLDDLKQLA